MGEPAQREQPPHQLGSPA
jgi:hypothetical protein